jgi:hypothetical protein
MYWPVAFGIAFIAIYIYIHISTILSAWDSSIPFFVFVIFLWALMDFGLVGYFMSRVSQ